MILITNLPGLSVKSSKEDLFMNVLASTNIMVSEAGYIKAKMFRQCLLDSRSYTRCSLKQPLQHILDKPGDNHISHSDLQAFNYCRKNHIDLLSLLPHLSHKI